MREKILKSLNTSDLTQEEWESAAHVVAALGASQRIPEPELTVKRRLELLAGLNLPKPRKHLTVGAMLLHIKAGQARFLPRVLELTWRYVASKAARDRWTGVTHERAKIIAQIALDRFLDPLCEVCNGVGRIGEFGQTIILCSKSAGGCGGSGKKGNNWHGWMERVKDVLSMLESWEGYAASGTARQAGRTRFWG